MVYVVKNRKNNSVYIKKISLKKEKSIYIKKMIYGHRNKFCKWKLDFLNFYPLRPLAINPILREPKSYMTNLFHISL